MQVTTNYRFFNGKNMTQEQCDSYNQIWEEITWKKAAGRNTDYLEDCAHKMVNYL